LNAYEIATLVSLVARKVVRESLVGWEVAILKAPTFMEAKGAPSLLNNVMPIKAFTIEVRTIQSCDL